MDLKKCLEKHAGVEEKCVYRAKQEEFFTTSISVKEDFLEKYSHLKVPKSMYIDMKPWEEYEVEFSLGLPLNRVLKLPPTRNILNFDEIQYSVYGKMTSRTLFISKSQTSRSELKEDVFAPCEFLYAPKNYLAIPFIEKPFPTLNKAREKFFAYQKKEFLPLMSPFREGSYERTFFTKCVTGFSPDKITTQLAFFPHQLQANGIVIFGTSGPQLAPVFPFFITL